MNNHRSNHRTWGLIALAGGMALILYWVLYTLGLVRFESDQAGSQDLTRIFESAFPIADTVLALCLLVAGIGLLRKRNHGWFFLTMAASMTLYLGILDLTFYAGHGFYSDLGTGTFIEATANLFCLAGGFFGLLRSWKSRRML